MSPEAVSAVGLLVSWANEQDQWVREVVSDAIQSRRPVADGRIEEYVELLLREKGLADGDPPAIEKLEVPGGEGAKSQALVLTNLGSLENINALAAGQNIPFNPKMTVLFGENAAGKSGYVRVLKSAASVRSAEPVLPNIHETGATGPQSAKISFKLGDTEDSVTWRGRAGLHPITTVDVLDARAAVLHVDDDLTYSYTPSDLALFPLVTDSVERVKAILEKKRAGVAPTTNPFLAKFGRDSSVYARIENLGPATDLPELERLAEVPDAEERGLDELRRNVEALGSRAPQDRVAVVTADWDLYRQVQTAAEILQRFSVQDYRQALESLRQSRERHEAATRTAFEAEDLPGVLGEEWTSFIRAGEDYLRTIEEADYPGDGDSCAYCRQPLQAAAAALVRKYRAYSNDSLAKDLEKRSEAVRSIVGQPLGIEVSQLRDELARRAAVVPAGQAAPAVLAESQAMVVAAEQLQATLRTTDDTDQETIADSSQRVAKLAGEHVGALAEALSALGKEATERLQLHAKEVAKLRLLEARIQVRTLLPQLRSHVLAAKWAEKAKTILGRFQGLKRTLTDASKVASEELLNNDFERNFKAECGALKAPPVALDFPGRRGEAARRKRLVPEYKLSEILSEGEQKVIALADFIAEASLKPTASPVIFDDPVNSLDYQRLRHVADRLAALTTARQVIVFTHNIWFAAEILARFDNSKADCAYFDISEAPPARGIISPGNHPRWESIKKTSGKINTLIQEARTARSAGGERLVAAEALVDAAYGQLRDLTETIVEQELFCGVTQRYSAHVAMTKLPSIRVDRLPAAIASIHPIYDKCNRVTGVHSQPSETLSVRPTIEELEADWKTIQDARQGYLAT